MSRTKSGFTIVELLIVIVVIAILAAISIVAYNGMQARAQDSAIVNGVNQIEKALKLWSTDNGNVLSGGSGSTIPVSSGKCSDGIGAGFFGRLTYPCAIEDALVSASLLPDGFSSKLPGNSYYGNHGRYSVMVYKCSSPVGQYSIYWTLRNPSSQDTNNLNSLIASCGSPTQVRDNWGMRAGRTIQL